MLEALPQRLTAAVDVAAEAPNQTVFAHLAQVAARMQMIAATIIAQYGQGRKVLVLTERTDHLERLQQALADRYSRSSCCMGASRKRRVRHSSRPLTRWPLARRGSCWRPAGRRGFRPPGTGDAGTRHAGGPEGHAAAVRRRLHCEHAGKTGVRVLDYVDGGHP
ncbi:hypothetical protein M3I54_36180 [Paraburkholderia sp. CNPSo 3274]|uniref:hypothetical protein n=1 Tax=Paraburkholderia sp. CNPSo 3274 TaxID=2940932 RepID=UPI0020B70603|nr:hypothetical protein [Paraburkholderia sp. CNPSo 3274]MCP3712320.1 hypothetical protein [Paraburkholderia sp. CNPSo 3274]